MKIDGKKILITGGTGSFGKHFIRHILETYDVKQVIIYSRDELKQFEQAQSIPDPRLHYILGDVRDRERLKFAMEGVDIVVHAAAMKQVVASEMNPTECIRTNIGGAENIIEAAIANNVSHVLALSTDKAVNPINLYGATKLCSDKLIVNANNRSAKTLFSVVRYGNVIGSRGSVIPFFRSLRHTGTLPITDARMTRFWIRLSDGVHFVSKCLEIMRGAEVFVTKLPSIKIVDLATALAPECEQKIIGIRPGEKLHEVMVPVDEARRTREFKDFYVILSDTGAEVAQKEIEYNGEVGLRVPEDFQYSSDTNSTWMTPEELVQSIPPEPE